jgi:hypothetical protein
MTCKRFLAIVLFAAWTAGSGADQAALLEKGQYLQVRINDELNSDKSKPGDRFSATLVLPVTLGRVLPHHQEVTLRKGTTYKAVTEVRGRISFPAPNNPGMAARGWVTVPAGREFSLERFNLPVRIVQFAPSFARDTVIDINEGQLLENVKQLTTKTALSGRVTAVEATADKGGPWVEVEFDQMRTPDNRSLSIKGKLVEVMAPNSLRLEPSGRFRDEVDWKDKRWVFMGSGGPAAIAVLTEGTRGATRGPVKIKKGTEVGVVLTESVMQ